MDRMIGTICRGEALRLLDRDGDKASRFCRDNVPQRISGTHGIKKLVEIHLDILISESPPSRAHQSEPEAVCGMTHWTTSGKRRRGP